MGQAAPISTRPTWILWLGAVVPAAAGFRDDADALGLNVEDDDLALELAAEPVLAMSLLPCCFEPATTAASIAIGRPEAIDDAPLAGRSTAEDGGGESFLSREEWASARGKKVSPPPLRLRRSRRSRRSARSSHGKCTHRGPNSARRSRV
jgi:hypothetical protein